MIDFLKSLSAFIIGVVLLFIFYIFVNIPIIHCIYIYAIAILFLDKKTHFRTFFIIIGSLIGICLYGLNVVVSIINYPDYLTIIGILLEVVDIFAIIGTSILYVIEMFRK